MWTHHALIFKRGIAGNVNAYVMNKNDVLGARLIGKFKGGVTKAIERRYLHELMLIVTPTKEDVTDAIEMYTWTLRYDADGEPQAELRQADGTVMAALRFKGMPYLKKQTVELLALIRSLCRGTLGPLPAGASSSIRITYTDRTPKGYQAPGFYRCTEDPVLRPDAQEIEIGTLQTNYHRACVRVRSVFVDDAYAVGLRLKEGMKLFDPDDSLNGSFGKEMGAVDKANRSVRNDTIEHISELAIQQAVLKVVMDVSTPPIKTTTGVSYDTQLAKIPSGRISCESITPEETPAKRRRSSNDSYMYSFSNSPYLD